jgi:formylglycine-generating enzyme required for sulfatase activity
MSSTSARIEALSHVLESILCPPFRWCFVDSGLVRLEDASHDGGTPGVEYRVAEFAIARYPVTNAQYQKFIDASDGFGNSAWWEYSPQAARWRLDHPRPRPTAFAGDDLPRTRVSWFDSLAFCHWLSAELARLEGGAPPDARDITTWRVRLPTEQEWQRAALGESGWRYPWGDELDEMHANFANTVGRPSPVGTYPNGASPCGALDMIGNVWEWCLDGWGAEVMDVTGYTYRPIRGGAWNVSNPEHLRAADRGASSPRGQLNDAGFRCALLF